MSKQTSNCSQPEANENDFETQLNPIHFPPPRTPLNTIADPAQFAHHSDFDSSFFATKFESLRHGRYSLSDRKLEARGNVGKAHSEPNSAQSTPARRISVGGVIGACNGSRVSLYTGNKAGNSKTCKAISAVNSELLPDEIPHFELVEDSSFWTDHNVQVLIRIRPLSSRERATPGYGRCLKQESAQTMVWLGHPETRFTFDHIACETISQESLFRVAGLPMVENCLSGYNSCMFAYGQTGSGKTYTMMSEINEIEGKFNEDCGITPRIFEYLFQRIRAEEESRKNEQLKYSCKCSFLEIYNEQITDLLEPSSTNLQIREDLKKGVHVENLKEYNVGNVRDVVKLLLQGAVTRKMAATHMNSESSRSHSVFTCTIESNWEKDSMTHFRFARLNLVDLAGSERQKSSGAEGDRLKEAANINKSLSTLGLVIMSLVDLAHGKHRHVPYRDSRLTFLLQDSLGGNSKTTIIANVSPSICSANETLSTLKFAQRAKLIQNNAKVNEDASGDINALQWQIQQLKGQLSFLMKHNYQLSSCVTNIQESRFNDLPEEYHSLREESANDNRIAQRVQNNKIKCMEASLAGALRREKVAETAIQNLEAEAERMNYLACKREEDSQHTKMMLKFRDEKIERLELLVDGMLSAETYLMQENKTLLEEIQLLRARIDRNPELSQISVENHRLREQLQSIQNFYKHGERESLLAEVSELRNQLLEILEGKVPLYTNNEYQDKDTMKELEHCRNMNSKLIREVDELRLGLRKYINCSQVASDSVPDSFSKDTEEFRQPDKDSLVESISLQSDAGNEMTSYTQTDDEAVLNHVEQYMGDGPVIPPNIRKELIEVLEPKQVCLNSKLKHVQDESCRYMEISSCKDNLERQSVLKPENNFSKVNGLDKQHNGQVMDSSGEIERMALQAKLYRMNKDLEEVRLLNSKLQENQELQLSSQHETELVCEQVEVETARTILQLQDEVAALQCELDERLYYVTQENTKLRNVIEAKEEKIKEVGMEWERATVELTGFLVDGSRSLNNVSGQIESIACSFPQANAWISEHVVRAAKVCIEKEETILHLQRSLEDAQNMVMDMGQKLSSLKGATLALTEFQQLNNSEASEEECQLSLLLKDNTNMLMMLQRKLKVKEAQVLEAEKCANVAFIVINWLSDRHKVARMGETEDNIPISKKANPIIMANHKIAHPKDDANILVLEDIIAQVELARLGVFDSGNALNAIYADTEMHIEALQTNIQEILYTYRELVQNLVKEIQEMRMKYMEVREQCKISECITVDTLPLEEDRCLKSKNLYHMLHQIRDELNETNDRLKIIEDFINTEVNAFECSSTDGGLVNADSLSADCSSSSSDFSTASVDLGSKFHESSCTCCTEVEGSMLLSNDQDSKDSKKILKSLINCEAPINSLKKELKMICDSFKKLYVRLATLVDDLDSGDCSYAELKQLVPSSKLGMEVKARFHNPIEVEGDEKVDRVTSFLTKFEQARLTIREADIMLNALLKANENSKQLTGMWKQTGEKLTVERASLVEEVKYLKSSICVKEREQEETHYKFEEITNSLCSLEECFMQLKIDVEKRLKDIYSDVYSMGIEMLSFVGNSRSLLEDICYETLEKGFASFVLYQCHLGELIRKIPCFNVDTGFHLSRSPESYRELNKLQKSCSRGKDEIMITCKKSIDEGDQSEVATNAEGGELGLSHDSLINENLSLTKELQRKEVLLEGLLFDFKLLQESASNRKDIKDETENLIYYLSQVRHELEMKTSQLDDMLVQNRELEHHLNDTEKALFISNSKLDQAMKEIETFSDQNAELKMLLKDLYIRKSDAEEQLEEQKEVVKSMENEILQLTSSAEMKFLSSVESIEDNMKRITSERDQLIEEVQSLNNKLEMVYALAEENEAVAVEARQESEASKIYAEQKEEEVKILECSVEELDCTINVLEKKVYEMDDEVERHRLIRDSLELELQALRQRLSTVENSTGIVDSDNTNAERTQIFVKLQNKSLELHEAHTKIKLLEEERAEQDKEIKQCKEYISELVLHAEAQASQYQQKYKTLEAMVREVQIDSTNPTSTASTSYQTEKGSVRTRGSSSPFRCIAGLVQQMNLEKDQELSAARYQIEELGALATSRQREVCMLNTRLAAAESMTHDVIRDLLGVKLDMTNFANLIDEHQVKKLVEEAHQQTEEFQAKEQEIINLRKQINDLIEERESCILGISKREGDILALQITIQQLQERDQLLSAQNEMLKMDKTNLKKKVEELDDMVKTILGTKSTEQRIQPSSMTKKSSLKLGDVDFAKKLERSEKLLSRVNGELSQYHKYSSSLPHDKIHGHGFETNFRKQKTKFG